MDLSTVMQKQDFMKTQLEVDAFNKTINEGKKTQNSLGKDDFLKILITQLQNQDPSQPMQDKEFIAQMAQFSSLEQMTNMAKDFSRIAGLIGSTQAQDMIGRNVEIDTGSAVVKGIVSEVVRGDFPLVVVNEQAYDYNQVSKILN